MATNNGLPDLEVVVHNESAPASQPPNSRPQSSAVRVIPVAENASNSSSALRSLGSRPPSAAIPAPNQNSQADFSSSALSRPQSAVRASPIQNSQSAVPSRPQSTAIPAYENQNGSNIALQSLEARPASGGRSFPVSENQNGSNVALQSLEARPASGGRSVPASGTQNNADQTTVETNPPAAEKDNLVAVKGKVFIKLPILIGSIALFVASCLLVGLLVGLVNIPYEDQKVSNAQPLTKAQIFKRSLKEDLPICPDLNTNNQNNPWQSLRLPTNIAPRHYDLEIYTPIFAAEEYSGEVTIRIEVLQPTDTILVHAKFLGVYLASLVDSNNNPVELNCAGDFLPNDYYVLKTSQSLARGTYSMKLYFTGFLDEYNSGLFEIKYNNDDDEFDGSLLASHFEPTEARKAFPCFDEPQLRATYRITLRHPVGTQALSNMPIDNEDVIDGEVHTKFQQSPALPTYLIGMTIFNKTDFVVRESKSKSGIPIRLWTKKENVEAGIVQDTLVMIVDIFNGLEELLIERVSNGAPPKIDVFASPFYPEDGVPHFGLPIFKENRILFEESSISERRKQSIALLIAKQLSEFWFGNYVGFRWWNELWLQEALGDYFKYRVLSRTYPDWRVYDQFITEELIGVFNEDALQSSHPVIKNVNSPIEIAYLFDKIETAKATAVLRMVEYDIGESEFLNALINYLNSATDGLGDPDKIYEIIGEIRGWSAKEFFNRWFLQSNFPLVHVSYSKNSADNKFHLKVKQERYRSEYTEFGDDLYPSPYDWTWYIPLTCIVGRSIYDPEPLELIFAVDQKEVDIVIDDESVTSIGWIHCNDRFAGYYLFNYTTDNWQNLGRVMRASNLTYLQPVDKASILNNVFVNAYNGKESYFTVADVVTSLSREEDFLPWRTVYEKVNDLANILQYDRSFFNLSEFFIYLIRAIERKVNVWEASGDHTEELKREVILEFSCRMQDIDCLKNATDLWPTAYNSIVDPSKPNDLPPHVRGVVYNYHFENAYNSDEWEVVFNKKDLVEEEMLLEAVTFSRVPWLLAYFLDDIDEQAKLFEFFDGIKLLSRNPLGRELTWNYIRENFVDITTRFGYLNPSIGNMILDVVTTFSDRFMFIEMLTFFYEIDSEPNEYARYKASEIVSTNVEWLGAKREEIIQAFGGFFKKIESKNF